MAMELPPWVVAAILLMTGGATGMVAAVLARWGRLSVLGGLEGPFLAQPRTFSWSSPATVRRAVAPALLYLAIRLLGSLLFWVMAWWNRRPVNLLAWDGEWYLRIAEFGYLTGAHGMVDAHGKPSPFGAMAFFPGYPHLVRGVAPLLGDDYLAAGLVVSTVAGVAGGYAVARLARHCGADRRGELIAVAALAAAPMSVVFTLPYPESMLVAVVGWALVGLLERRWWLAIACSAAAGYLSPMGVPLIPVVIAAIVVHRKEAGWPALLGTLLTPAGLLGYLLWVDRKSGMTGGFFAITKAGWGNEIDFGWTTLTWVLATFAADPNVFTLITAAVIVVAGTALIWSRGLLPWPVWTYCLFTIGLAFGSGGLVQDRVRLLLSAFPLMLPLAIVLSGLKARWAIASTAFLVLAGLWFSAHSLTVWRYGI